MSDYLFAVIKRIIIIVIVKNDILFRENILIRKRNRNIKSLSFIIAVASIAQILDLLARPERFELPTSWFVGMKDTPVYARPAPHCAAYQ